MTENEKKQIEKMAELICDNKCDNGTCSTDGCICNYNCEYKYSAEALYNAGYRKQSVGEWIDKPTGAYGRMQSWCSACGKHSGIGGIESNRHKPFCPNCGAKMFVRMTHTCPHNIPNLIPTIEELLKGGEG